MPHPCLPCPPKPPVPCKPPCGCMLTQPTPPSNPNFGDTWINNSGGSPVFNYWDGRQWVTLAPTTAPSATPGVTITGPTTSVPVGGVATLTITISNFGATNNVIVQYIFGSGMEYVGGAVSGPTADFTAFRNVGLIYVNSLASGLANAVTITMPVTVLSAVDNSFSASIIFMSQPNPAFPNSLSAIGALIVG